MLNLPKVADPPKYNGLYVFSHGDWTGLGYTADEIALLLESEQYRDGAVYKIVRASPDGQMELRGVTASRFQLESGMFFVRSDRAAAQADFRALVAQAAGDPPPCRATVQLAERRAEDDGAQYVVALIYPAEYEDEMAAWLLANRYSGGDLVEGGVSHVTNYYDEPRSVLDREQLWSRKSTSSRTRDEVYRSVGVAVQR